MKDYRDILKRLFIHALLSAPFFWIGWRLIPAEGGWGAVAPILGGMLCFVCGACLLAIPLAQAAAEPWGALYFPTRMPSGKRPMYGIPQSRRKKGRYEEAMAAYEAIEREYPTELRVYVEMMDMAVVDMKDLSRAERIHERGQLAIQNEDARRALDTMFRAISSRLHARRGGGKW